MADVRTLDYVLTRCRAKPDEPKRAYTATHHRQDGSIEDEEPLAEEVEPNSQRRVDAGAVFGWDCGRHGGRPMPSEFREQESLDALWERVRDLIPAQAVAPQGRSPVRPGRRLPGRPGVPAP